MGFFGSGDKTSTSTDNRVGASDNAIVLREGAFLFNPGRSLANETVSAPAEKPNWKLIGLAAAVLIVIVFLLTSTFSRK